MVVAVVVVVVAVVVMVVVVVVAAITVMSVAWGHSQAAHLAINHCHP